MISMDKYANLAVKLKRTWTGGAEARKAIQQVLERRKVSRGVPLLGKDNPFARNVRQVSRFKALRRPNTWVSSPKARKAIEEVARKGGAPRPQSPTNPFTSTSPWKSARRS